MKKIAIISSGYFPVPSVKGGAVETLIQAIIDENESSEQANQLEINVFSMYDCKAQKYSLKYKNTNFLFVKVPHIVKIMDNFVYSIAKNILKINKHMSFRFIVQRIHYIFKVAYEIHRNDYERLIIENTATLFWSLKFFNNEKKYKDKYIYHLHNEISSTFGCEKQILGTETVWGVSEFVNRTFCETFPQYSSERCKVLKNCVDLTKFSSLSDSTAFRMNYGIEADEKIILFAGRLCEEKGVKEVLLAFSELDIHDVRLIIVGNYYFGTDMISSFEKEIFDLAKPLGDRVIFAGYIPNDQIGEYYNSADIAVLPSIWNEPAGLTIIEAMSSGLPVITTDSGGIPEYIDSTCAIILDRNKSTLVNELKTNIESLLGDEERMKRMSEAAKENSMKYGKDIYFNKYTELLSQ